jgi:threonine/homoserine/homoserine lactone efflux protein
MLTDTQISPFLATAVLPTATPGPDNLMGLSIGMSQGRRAGCFSGSVGAWLNRLAGTVFLGLGLRRVTSR